MPCFQLVSYAFSMLKNMATAWRFFNGSFSEKAFEADFVIDSAPVFTETILYRGYEFVFLEVPH